MSAPEHTIAALAARWPSAYRALRRAREALGNALPPRRVDGLGPVHRNDLMYRHGAHDAAVHYRSLGELAASLCADAVRDCGGDEPSRILDFGCGHGRCARALRARWPGAELTVADVDPAAVAFCAEQFRATGRTIDPLDIELPSHAFDLIWVGSVVTHLRRRDTATLLRSLAGATQPGRPILVTTLGSELAGDGVRHRSAAASALAEVRATGFAYVPYPHARGEYGLAWFEPHAFEATANDAGLRTVWHLPRGWGDHQDAWCLTTLRPPPPASRRGRAR